MLEVEAINVGRFPGKTSLSEQQNSNPSFLFHKLSCWLYNFVCTSPHRSPFVRRSHSDKFAFESCYDEDDLVRKSVHDGGMPKSNKMSKSY